MVVLCARGLGFNPQQRWEMVFIAVCVYRLVMISIERSEKAQKSALEIRDKFSPRQNAVQDKIQSETKFSPRILFAMVGKHFFFSD